MLGAARRYRIGKFGKTAAAHQVHVLDFDITGRASGRLQQEVDPRIGAVLHLAARAGIAGELGNRARRDRLGDQQVGMRGVDADQLGPGAEIDLDQFPTVRQLAREIFRFRQPDPRARRRQPDHRARIGDMHRDRLAGRQHHIGEETLVAARQGGRDERFGEEHGGIQLGGFPRPACGERVRVRGLSTNSVLAEPPHPPRFARRPLPASGAR